MLPSLVTSSVLCWRLGCSLSTFLAFFLSHCASQLDEQAGGKAEVFEGPNAWWKTLGPRSSPSESAGAPSGKSPPTPQQEDELLFIPFSSDCPSSESAPGVSPTSSSSELNGLLRHATGAVSRSDAESDEGTTSGNKAAEPPSAKGAFAKGLWISSGRYRRLSLLQDSTQSVVNSGRVSDAAMKKGSATQGNPAPRLKGLTYQPGAPSSSAEGCKQTVQPSEGPSAANVRNTSISEKPSLSGNKDPACAPGVVENSTQMLRLPSRFPHASLSAPAHGPTDSGRTGPPCTGLCREGTGSRQRRGPVVALPQRHQGQD